MANNPNTPGGSDGYQDPYSHDEVYEEGYEEPEVDSGASAVASARGKSIILLVAATGLIGYIVYNTFFVDEAEEIKKAKEEKAKEEGQAITQNALDLDNIRSDQQVKDDKKKKDEESGGVAKPVELPTVVPPTAPPENSTEVAPAMPTVLPPVEVPLPPTPPAPPKAPVAALPPATDGPAIDVLLRDNGALPQGYSDGKGGGSAEEAKALYLKRSAQSLIISGGGGGSGGNADGDEKEGKDTKKDKEKSVSSLFSSQVRRGTVLPTTSAPNASATTIDDLMVTVAQGKMIDAVLETAINTDLSGQLRAVISKDVFSEQGRNVLIPRGSRMIGNYDSSVKRGQVRVNVSWTRVIRPDGVDIAIDSPGTDRLGRAGIAGAVDNKYLELFGGSLILSAMSTGVALVAEQFSSGSGVTSTETEGGNQQRSGSLTDLAVSDSVTRLGESGSNLSDELLKTNPTITIDQGTRVKVYVNRDLIISKVY